MVKLFAAVLIIIFTRMVSAGSLFAAILLPVLTLFLGKRAQLS